MHYIALFKSLIIFFAISGALARQGDSMPAKVINPETFSDTSIIKSWTTELLLARNPAKLAITSFYLSSGTSFFALIAISSSHSLVVSLSDLSSVYIAFGPIITFP